MPTNRPASLRQVRADWLRAQSEVAYVRMLVAGRRYREALKREERFNPYHDELGRFTTPDNAVPPKGEDSGSNNRVRVAQAGPARPYIRSTILARFPTATPEQEVRWAVSDVWARDEIAQTEAVIPGYRARPSLTSTIEGEITRNEADARDAREAREGYESESLTGDAGLNSRSEPKSLDEVCRPGGNLIGTRSKGARENVRTVAPEEFDQLLRDLTHGASDAKAASNYAGLWFRRSGGEIIGIRRSQNFGLTIDIVDSLDPISIPKIRIHER